MMTPYDSLKCNELISYARISHLYKHCITLWKYCQSFVDIGYFLAGQLPAVLLDNALAELLAQFLAALGGV